MFNTLIIQDSHAGLHQYLSIGLKRILFKVLHSSRTDYESKQMKVIKASSGVVQIPYAKNHKNETHNLNGLSTAGLGPLNKSLSMYESNLNKPPPRVMTQICKYIQM